MDSLHRRLQLEVSTLYVEPDSLLEIFDRVANGILKGLCFLDLMLRREAVEDRPRHYYSRVEVIRRRKTRAHRAVTGRRSHRRKIIAAGLPDLRTGRSRLRFERAQVRPDCDCGSEQ